MQYVVNATIAGATYGLVGLSFSLIYAPAKFFHFAHGAVFAWGAYFCYFSHQGLGLPLWVSVLAALVIAGALGAVSDLIVYRPLRRQRGTSFVLLVASLGLYVLLEALIALLFGEENKTLRSSFTVRVFDVLGARITSIQLAIAATAIVALTLTWVVLSFTRIGVTFRAVSSDAELATVYGARVEKVVLGAFVTGSILAGLAGVLVAIDVDLRPTMGFHPLIMGIIAMVVGGVGSMAGAMLGGLVLGIVMQMGALITGAQWQDAIAYGLLILFLLFRPQGLLGKQRRRESV